MTKSVFIAFIHWSNKNGKNIEIRFNLKNSQSVRVPFMKWLFVFKWNLYNIWIRNFWFHAVLIKLFMANSFESTPKIRLKYNNRKNNGTKWSGLSIRIIYHNKAHLIFRITIAISTAFYINKYKHVFSILLILTSCRIILDISPVRSNGHSYIFC